MSRADRRRVASTSSVLCCFFFFSSRRRHTRFDCDWSSDVCSSDLKRLAGGGHHLEADPFVGFEIAELSNRFAGAKVLPPLIPFGPLHAAAELLAQDRKSVV